jgi:hypothetical protein
MSYGDVWSNDDHDSDDFDDDDELFNEREERHEEMLEAMHENSFESGFERLSSGSGGAVLDDDDDEFGDSDGDDPDGPPSTVVRGLGGDFGDPNDEWMDADPDDFMADADPTDSEGDFAADDDDEGGPMSGLAAAIRQFNPDNDPDWGVPEDVLEDPDWEASGRDQGQYFKMKYPEDVDSQGRSIYEDGDVDDLQYDDEDDDEDDHGGGGFFARLRGRLGGGGGGGEVLELDDDTSEGDAYDSLNADYGPQDETHADSDYEGDVIDDTDTPDVDLADEANEATVDHHDNSAEDDEDREAQAQELGGNPDEDTDPGGLLGRLL